ncbi:UvrD-helicase domain-containing protein, partial [Arthrospira platensis SPKY1]|nr:UvrD-helicase domain-containing protein [Arthrospira platensis SPKY1]
MWMGTFHSVFSKILRVEAKKLGYTSSFSIYDSDDSESVIKSIVKEMGHDPKEMKPKLIRHLISDAKNKLISADQFAQQAGYSPIERLTSQVYGEYNQRLLLNNAMDFDDLLVKPIELFAKHPDVLEAYQDR